MRVLIVGANGKIGRLLVPLLSAAGHTPVAMVRDGAQGPALVDAGAEVCVADLEGDIDDVVQDLDAVIFTAGSGAHTGGDKTLLVDLWGARKVIAAAEAADVRRFLMVSAIGAADPDRGPAAIRHYLVAKRLADDRLRESDLDYTIIRPGRLTDEPATGTIQITDLGYGEISRADVARAIAAAVDAPNTIRKTFCVLPGTTEIATAIAGV